MHMKYFQAIADIENHYKEILRAMKDERYGHGLLETWGIKPEEEELILEELEVLRYLIACQLGISSKKTTVKPSLEVVNRLFNRHLTFLEDVHNCHAYNVSKYPSSLVRKEYKACRHYLFKFSLPAWYRVLPESIPNYEEKYGRSLSIKEDIPIPFTKNQKTVK